MTNQEHAQTQQQTATLNLNSIMVGTAQPGVLAAFYEKVFGRPADMVEGEWYMWQAGNCSLSIGGMHRDPHPVCL